MESKLCFILCLFFQKSFEFDLPREGCNSDLIINNDHYNVSTVYHLGEYDPTDAHFNVRVVQFDTATPDIIPGLPEGLSYSIAVDTKNTKVFFGTGKGLYTYNYETHSATSISESTLKLNMVYIDKDSNKYITETNDGIEELYLYKNGKKYCFHTLEALSEMAIDDKNNFYYLKNEKLCVLKWNAPPPICIGNVSYDGMAQICFYKNTVFVASDNLWYLHENDTTLKLVVNAPANLTAMAFENTGEFVLGFHGKLVRYKKNQCFIRN